MKSNNFTISKKYDGCLGIIYVYNGKLRCNSRGAFNNYVTYAMHRIIDKNKLEGRILDLPYDLVVEVIAPETKIVLKYDFEDLILLTAYRYNDFKEVSIEEADDIAKSLNLKWPEKNKMTYDELFKWQKVHDWTEEGFVLRYDDNYRVKIKSEDYMRVGVLKANLSEKHICNVMKDNHNDYINIMNEIMKNTPDEFQREAENIVKNFERKDLRNATKITDFDEGLFCALVENVIVSKNDIKIRWKDEIEP